VAGGRHLPHSRSGISHCTGPGWRERAGRSNAGLGRRNHQERPQGYQRLRSSRAVSGLRAEFWARLLGMVARDVRPIGGGRYPYSPGFRISQNICGPQFVSADRFRIIWPYVSRIRIEWIVLRAKINVAWKIKRPWPPSPGGTKSSTAPRSMDWRYDDRLALALNCGAGTRAAAALSDVARALDFGKDLRALRPLDAGLRIGVALCHRRLDVTNQVVARGEAAERIPLPV
jgi:hypothetical protein